MACEYPDASTPDELFANVVAGRRAFRRIPDERLPLAAYGEVEGTADADRTYVSEAALIEGWSFDRQRFKVVGSTYRSADLTHWLALDVADRALRDAGFAQGAGLPRERTGVVLGNTLTGEFSRAQALRLRWPYVERVLDDSLAALLPDAVARRSFLAEVEARYKAPFEVFGDESLAGGLANTIAGRICNHFDLLGGGFTVDGACSSSLLAVANAADALRRGDLDVALAGGVDLSLDPFELVGFARAGALARHEMRVYDRRAEGFWPGEGCGILVLMRESDARAGGCEILARLRGWGISSDGSGGIARPELEGQLLALRRAYANAGFGPETVGYFEGHGTATAIGDATELGALTRLRVEAAAQQPAVIGSVKACIGHTKAAAGVAGLIQAALALRERTLPPLPGCERPDARVDPQHGAALRVLRRAEPWPTTCPLRAGVSSMGFGGINVHVALDLPDSPPRPRRSPAPATLRDAELFLLGAATPAEWESTRSRLAALAPRLSRAELVDLAGALAEAQRRSARPPWLRVALVAARPAELAAQLESLRDWAPTTSGAEAPAPRIDPQRGVFAAGGARPPRIGLLFPGQGVALPAGLGVVGEMLDEAAAAWSGERYAAALGTSPFRTDALGPDTAVVQPAVIAAALAGAAWLEAQGIDATLAIGHSVGEIAALQWAGALAREDAFQLATRRGRILSESASAGGAMASLCAERDEVLALAKGCACTLAAHNAPRRWVVSGDVAAVDRVLERARDRGIAGLRLEVSHAFHSPHVAACAGPLAQVLATLPVAACARRVVSTRTGETLPPDADLRAHLAAQLVEPVLFSEAVARAASDVDLFVDVGPGRTLASLARESTGVAAVALDTGSQSARDALAVAGAAWALGAALRTERLFAGRRKPFDVERPLRLFRNPCSPRREPEPDARPEERATELPAPADEPDDTTLGLLLRLVAERCELPHAAVSATDRFLSDLHLSSIAVSELAARAVQELGRPPLAAPGEFADATLAELAQAIESDDRTPTFAEQVAGVDVWTRAFQVVWLERERPRASRAPSPGAEPGAWRVFAPPGDTLAPRLAEALQRQRPSGGVLLHLAERQSEPGERGELGRLLEACRAAFEGLSSRHFVVVHHGHEAVAMIRCLHQEARSLSTRLVELPLTDNDPVSRVLAEVGAATPYLEARYDATGRRFERRLELLSSPRVPPESARALPLGPHDVLLVTGGGKGIAAECALALARRSGCALGLIGRSSPEDDAALRHNLARFEAARVRYAYASADVADAAALREATRSLDGALGPPTALLHGAGSNRPQALTQLDEAEIADTLAAKTRGLEHLLAQLDAKRLRCVVAFGSVVAEIGLPGEAHYALANERLARRLDAFAREHPQVRCLCVDWSIWSGVGMGERLGRVEVLAARNVSPITPDEGVRWLERLLEDASLPTRVFLSGRFGNPPTLAVREQALPLARFVERVREHTPGVELVVDADLAHESDPYLADHVYAGACLLPGVVGLEAMAQVAAALAGREEPPVFERVRFLQPVVVPRNARCTVRVAGLLREDGRIELALRCESTGFQRNHMQAEIRYAPGTARVAAPIAQRPRAAPGLLGPGHSLYGDLFFHRGRFARVRDYTLLRSRACRAEIEGRDEPLFGSFLPQTLRLGDAGARDAAVHAVQACIPDRDLLPVAVERIEIGALTGQPRLAVRGSERERGGGRYVWDLDVLGPDGVPLERWRGLELAEVPGAAPREIWSAPLLAPFLEELAAQHFTGAGFRVVVVAGEDRAAREHALRIVHGAPRRVCRRPDGRPVSMDDRSLSLSHAVGHTLAVVGREPVACDIEGVAARPEAVWRAMLGAERFRMAAGLATARGESLDAAATRLFGASECAKKLGLRTDAPWLVASRDDDGLVQLVAGEHAALSLRVRIRDVADPVVLTLLSRTRSGERALAAANATPRDHARV